MAYSNKPIYDMFCDFSDRKGVANKRDRLENIFWKLSNEELTKFEEFVCSRGSYVDVYVFSYMYSFANIDKLQEAFLSKKPSSFGFKFEYKEDEVLRNYHHDDNVYDTFLLDARINGSGVDSFNEYLEFLCLYMKKFNGLNTLNFVNVACKFIKDNQKWLTYKKKYGALFDLAEISNGVGIDVIQDTFLGLDASEEPPQYYMDGGIYGYHSFPEKVVYKRYGEKKFIDERLKFAYKFLSYIKQADLNRFDEVFHFDKTSEDYGLMYDRYCALRPELFSKELADRILTRPHNNDFAELIKNEEFREFCKQNLDMALVLDVAGRMEKIHSVNEIANFVAETGDVDAILKFLKNIRKVYSASNLINSFFKEVDAQVANGMPLSNYSQDVSEVALILHETNKVSTDEFDMLTGMMVTPQSLAYYLKNIKKFDCQNLLDRYFLEVENVVVEHGDISSFSEDGFNVAMNLRMKEGVAFESLQKLLGVVVAGEDNAFLVKFGYYIKGVDFEAYRDAIHFDRAQVMHELLESFDSSIYRSYLSLDDRYNTEYKYTVGPATFVEIGREFIAEHKEQMKDYVENLYFLANLAQGEKEWAVNDYIDYYNHLNDKNLMSNYVENYAVGFASLSSDDANIQKIVEGIVNLDNYIAYKVASKFLTSINADYDATGLLRLVIAKGYWYYPIEELNNIYNFHANNKTRTSGVSIADMEQIAMEKNEVPLVLTAFYGECDRDKLRAFYMQQKLLERWWVRSELKEELYELDSYVYHKSFSTRFTPKSRVPIASDEELLRLLSYGMSSEIIQKIQKAFNSKARFKLEMDEKGNMKVVIKPKQSAKNLNEEESVLDRDYLSLEKLTDINWVKSPFEEYPIDKELPF